MIPSWIASVLSMLLTFLAVFLVSDPVRVVEEIVTRQLAEFQLESKLSDPDRFREWVRETSGGVPYEDVGRQAV